MNLRGIGCENGMWKELVQNHVQWRASVLAALNLRFVLKESQFVNL
jgi:hypothetical protein